jgi:hypothetical protein
MTVGYLDGIELDELMKALALERELELIESDVKAKLKKKREGILGRLDDSKEIV